MLQCRRDAVRFVAGGGGGRRRRRRFLGDERRRIQVRVEDAADVFDRAEISQERDQVGQFRVVPARREREGVSTI